MIVVTHMVSTGHKTFTVKEAPQDRLLSQSKQQFKLNRSLLPSSDPAKIPEFRLASSPHENNVEEMPPSSPLSSCSPSPSPISEDFGCNTVPCPMCSKPVEIQFVGRLGLIGKDLKGLTYDRARAFCIAHSASTAEKRFKLSDYPRIDWDTFDTRLYNYHDTLLAILEKRTESTFRQDLQKKIEQGKSRNALRNPENAGHVPGGMGYYGARGAQKMTSHILNHLSEQIRTSASSDGLFTEVGVPGFVQAVLLPELVLLLVRDDYNGCDEDHAKQILEESKDLGDAQAVDEQDGARSVRESAARLVPWRNPQDSRAGITSDTEVIEIFSQESV